MLKIILSLLLFHLSSFNNFYFTDDVPFKTTTIKYDFSAIDKILNDSVAEKFDGHCFALICVNGKVEYSKGFGGYTADTRQLIASSTKWLSAAVVMSLVDEGKLKLTDTVGKFLPEFSKNGKGNISISQLFSHTSGLPGNSFQGYERNKFLTLAQATDSIGKNVALIFKPGTKFFYGGLSMQVGGRICEVASGKTWQELFEQKIAKPCGMTNTNYGPFKNPIIAGGARSTANDYMKFLFMIMNKGIAENGKRVLRSSSVDAMEKSYTEELGIAYSPYPYYLLKNHNFYGLGNWRDLVGKNGELIENCSPGAFGTHPWINRDKKITGIIFTNVRRSRNEISKTAFTCFKIRSICRDIIN